MNVGGHGLSLEVRKANRLVVSSRDPQTINRWLGPNNMKHGINKLQALKPFFSTKKERAELLETIILLPKFQQFFANYETPESLSVFGLFTEDFGLYDALLSSGAKKNFIEQLVKYLLARTVDDFREFVLPRVAPQHRQMVQQQIARGFRRRAISAMLANWACLKHPLVACFTVLSIGSTQQFSIMFHLKQLQEPTFFGRMYVSFYATRFQRSRPGKNMLQKFFNLPITI